MNLTVNGKALSNIFNVTSREVHDAPAKDITAVEVPGRSGNALLPNHRFKNKIITYDGFIKARQDLQMTDWGKLSFVARVLKGFAAGPLDAGYLTIEDDYDPGFTRYGYLEGEIPIMPVLGQPYGATAKIRFNCKPFMYDESTTETITSFPKYLYNEEFYSALPYMEITWTGTTAWIKIETDSVTEPVGNTWTFTESTSGTYVYCCDSENMEWYAGNALKNANVTTASTEPVFPILGAPLPTGSVGQNKITASSNVSKIVIKPRWRRL